MRVRASDGLRILYASDARKAGSGPTTGLVSSGKDTRRYGARRIDNASSRITPARELRHTQSADKCELSRVATDAEKLVAMVFRKLSIDW